MLTQDQVLAAIKAGRNSECLDGRDYARLCDFFHQDHWETLGFSAEEGSQDHDPIPWTEENIVSKLRDDVEFGFEKALNKRGISSGFMYSVVKMWLWILEDDLSEFDEYAMYGLPLFKRVAVKYGFPNPIGDDDGSEDKYNTGSGWWHSDE